MILLEREALLSRLQSLLEEAAAGRGRVVALVGEAGVGKTTLAVAFAEMAAKQARVFRGACEDLSVPEPLAPLHDLAREAGWDLPRAVHRQPGRLGLFSEALKVFDTATTATLLVVEDLHWADDATLDLLRFLGRRLHNSRILLLVTARTTQGEGQSRIRRALVDLPADDVVRLEVPLLSQDAVIELARHAGRDGIALYRATAGNAFYVSELLRGGGGDPLPARLLDAVQARVERLPAPSRGVLDAVSIFPRRVETTLLESLCPTDLPAAIAPCLADGILIAEDQAYGFRHEIARCAVETMLSPGARGALNARALAVLRDTSGVAPARLVHHAAAANDSDMVRKFAPVAAQEAAAMGAHRQAADLYMTALAHANTFAIEERVPLYERCAFECHLVGRLDDAIRAQKVALELHRTRGDILRQGDGLRWLSRLSYLAGDRSAAEGYAERAVALLETADPGPELAMAYSNVAQLAMLADDRATARAKGEKAITLAERLEQPEILCHALNNVGTAEQWDDVARGRALLDRSLKMALEHDFQEHVARTFTNRACFEINQFGYAQAGTFLEQGIAYCMERDLDTWRDYMRGWLAELLLRRGCWNEAAETALLVVANDGATPLVRYPAVLALARLRTRRGDPAVEPLLAEISAFLDKGTELQRLAPYAALMAERAWLGAADPAEALVLLDKLEALAGSGRLVSEALAWRRRLVTARRPREMIEIAAPYRLPFNRDWRGAAEVWSQLGAPYEQALALSEGDTAAQRQALALLDSLGATAVAQHLRSQENLDGQRQGARGPRATTRANPAGLTRRQMDVLRLIDEGCSNAGIADRLFVSIKTVDHHVSAILEKLEAKSRGEAAATARRRGLL